MTTRVRQLPDGEELVLTDEPSPSHLYLPQSDPRADSFERRHQALAESRADRSPRQSWSPSSRRRPPRHEPHA
jgi:hypothetical protein